MQRKGGKNLPGPLREEPGNESGWSGERREFVVDKMRKLAQSGGE